MWQPFTLFNSSQKQRQEDAGFDDDVLVVIVKERDPLCSNDRYMAASCPAAWKLLLIYYLVQKMLPSEVMQLQDWAAQNFSIGGASNATTILWQLNEDGVFNAAGLKQLEVFFESIGRVDFAFVIHQFLLGDYNWLRQIPEVANRTSSVFHFSSSSVMAGASDSHDRSKCF